MIIYLIVNLIVLTLSNPLFFISTTALWYCFNKNMQLASWYTSLGSKWLSVAALSAQNNADENNC